VTPQEQADAIIADAAWGWATDPTRAIAQATQRAATAREGRAAQYVHGPQSQREASASHWTQVALILTEAAGREPGQVLTNLRDRQ
jgi:hypothetical protein